MNKNKGFTLIELLVVIAIIGILASVVLASLNSSRSKSADVIVKTNLNNIRTEAEIYYIEKGDYLGLCTNVSDMETAAKNVANNSSRCNDSMVTSWCVWAGLKSDLNKAWCVDSIGNSKEIVKPIVGSDNLSVCPS